MKRFPLSLPAVAAIAMMAFSTQAFAGPKKADIVDTAVKAGKFKTLATALTKAGLVEALKGKGPFTVFAPTDEAFAKLPKGTLETLLKPENKPLLTAILTYHVVPGKVTANQVVKLNHAKTLNGQQIDIKVKKGSVHIDGAKVIAPDVMASNGVIHVVDTVILPSRDDIIDTAVKAGKFKTLAAAIKAAGLVEALKGDGPFTVLAPTDDAFAKLPEGTVATLLKPENKSQLTAILKYHVVAGRHFASDVVKKKALPTLQGGKLAVKVSDKGVMIGDAKVIKTDIDASNGVIHVINSVLIPSGDNKQARAD